MRASETTPLRAGRPLAGVDAPIEVRSFGNGPRYSALEVVADQSRLKRGSEANHGLSRPAKAVGAGLVVAVVCVLYRGGPPSPAPSLGVDNGAASTAHPSAPLVATTSEGLAPFDTKAPWTVGMPRTLRPAHTRPLPVWGAAAVGARGLSYDANDAGAARSF